MSDATTKAGILVGGAVLFVILWEIRSAIGLFLGIDTPATPYIAVTVLIVAVVAVALNLGYLGGGRAASGTEEKSD
ncbi:hypothetical protein [Halalkalirubrum salinum]|uniref:hypothetical protein n=1 Tax=Halalkalirubrum salinum TaxID=2563889 RepID=UPI0010FAE442|nr:hypothetical protein [Halalkalirubrum salinum]